MIIAKFVHDKTSVIVSGLWQYDYGQILRIQGLNLPTVTEVHFSLDETKGLAEQRVATTKDGVTDVIIPDSMLENQDVTEDFKIYVFVYVSDENSGQTEYKIVCKVNARPKPHAYSVDEQKDYFRETIQLVNTSATSAVENAQKAQESEEHVKKMEETIKELAAQVTEDRTKTEEILASCTTLKEQVEKAKDDTQDIYTNALSIADQIRQANIQISDIYRNITDSCAKADEFAQNCRIYNDSAINSAQSAKQNVTQVEDAARQFMASRNQFLSEITMAKDNALKAIEDKYQEVANK